MVGSETEMTAETTSETLSKTGNAAAAPGAASLGLTGGPSEVPATRAARGLAPVTFPDVLGRSVRELIAELVILQDQITQIAARAGYSFASPRNPFAPAPDPLVDPTPLDPADHPGADGAESALGMIEALDLLEVLEQRERTVLAELHARPTPEPR